MQRAGKWLEMLPEFCTSILGRRHQAITLLLGAGASLSSGAPSTGAVADAIWAANPGRFKSRQDVYDDLVEITEVDKRNAIEPLFEDTVPYAGYRLLAALARSRPIIIVNLNWDDCVLRACGQMGVRCQPHDIADPLAEIRESIALSNASGSGIVDIHVHGRLGTEGHEAKHRLRFARLKTLTLKEDEFELLRECFDCATAVIGASLCAGRDLDTADLIEALRGSGDPHEPGQLVDMQPVWIAVREANGDEPDKIIHSVLRARRSSRNILIGPDVDFDRIMWRLRATDAGYGWSQLEANHPEIRLIDEPGLILPKPSLLRDALDRSCSVVVLPGRARQGKSTVAHILAHWISLCEPGEPQVRTYRTTQSDEALGALQKGDVIVVDDPFGEVSYRRSPHVFDALLTHPDNAGRIVVATRFETYQPACRDAGDEGLPAVSSKPADWWAASELELYAQRLKAGLSEHVRHDPVTFDTPYRVSQAALGHVEPRADEDETARTKQWLADELEGGVPHATLVLTVRLQDFYQPVPREELERAADYQPRGVDFADLGGILRVVKVEDEHLRIGHPEDIHAVDLLIREHRDLVDAVLQALSPHLPWLAGALAAWEAVVGSSAPVAPADIPDEILFEWTFELVQRAAAQSPAAALALLGHARRRAPDTWAFRELVFAAVCMWGAIADDPKAASFIKEVIRDRSHRGTYALVEALLRVRVDPPGELLGFAVTSIHDLARRRKAHEELVLIFDGLLWRDLPVVDATLRQLLKALLDAAEADQKLRAGFAAAAAYHRPGLDALLEHGLENPLQWTADAHRHPNIVAWLLQWHVAHQARVHALVTRQSFLTVDSDEIKYLGRGRCENRAPLERDQASGLHALIGHLLRSGPHAGWAIHLAVNVNAVAGEFDTGDLAEHVGRVDQSDSGLAGCALYEAPAPLHFPLADHFRGRGRRALLQLLGGGFEFEGVQVAPPRFRLTANGWALRQRWGLSDADLGDILGTSLEEPTAALAMLMEHAEEALNAGADEAGLATVFEHFGRGDTDAMELVPLRPPGAGEGHAEDISVVASVLAGASIILAPDERS